MRKVIVIVFVTVIACTPKEPAPIPIVSDYLPMAKGLYRTYEIDSVVVSQNVETEYKYEIRAEVIDSFAATGGGFTYVIRRSKRNTPTSPWQSIESWSARTNPYQAVVNEGNISFVKMASPLTNGKTWNGNAFNILGGTEKCIEGDSYNCDNYEIRNFGKSYETSGGKMFDNTVTVLENDNQDIIVSLDKRSEVYAHGVGLVYREVTLLNYCTDSNCLGTQFVESGLRFKQTIADYGGL